MQLNVVTINYNNYDGLKKTLSNISVIKKTFKINYIIIDGNSLDGSKELLNDYRSVIDIFISEKDSGIYNAMNKSIPFLKDGYVAYLNSGDIFDINNFQILFSEASKGEFDLIYGDYIIKNKNKYKHKSNKSENYLWKGYFCHQSLIVKKDYLVKFNFDENLKICGDSKFILQVINSNALIKKINVPFAIIEAGGVSDTKRVSSIIEQWKITKKLAHKPSLFIHSYFLCLLLKNITIIFCRKTKELF